MKHRDRVLTALNHEEPDRVPLDCGGRQTTLMLGAYENLKSRLDLEHLPTTVMSQKWQTAHVDESILERFSIDCRHVRPVNKFETSHPVEIQTDGSACFVDEWGITRKIEAGYAAIVEHPLKNAELSDLDNYQWPVPEDIYGMEECKAWTRQLYTEGEYAIVGCMGSPGNIFEQAWYLRGLPEFLLDMAGNKEFAHALLSKVLEIRKKNAEIFLKEVGEYLDVFQLADDLAMQNNPYFSLEMYREIIKPYQAELFNYVKSLTPAKIYYHSCGAVTNLIDDLIDVGVDILNPVQVSANGMGSGELKRRYGDRLTFWGAIDTSDVLPNGSPEDVRKEVWKRIQDLAPGGGYVLAGVHNLQMDIPPENVIAMYDAGLKFGIYPLSGKGTESADPAAVEDNRSDNASLPLVEEPGGHAIFQDLQQSLIAGRQEEVVQKVKEALVEGVNAEKILNLGLIAAMDVVGSRMQSNDMFIPEVLLSAKCMGAAVEVLKPSLGADSLGASGNVLIGTVKGDLHDIGKNLVVLMLESSGFNVMDLGVDVSPDVFVKEVQSNPVSIVALSALLTTTMPMLVKTIDALSENGLREKIKIIVGGAPVTREFADEIGADGYAADAGGAAAEARRLSS